MSKNGGIAKNIGNPTYKKKQQIVYRDTNSELLGDENVL